MARAAVEAKGKEGIIQLICHITFIDQMEAMFTTPEQLPAGELTDGEQALNCIDCIVHKVRDFNARPVLANRDQVVESELLMPGPQRGFEELFLHCPAMAHAAASGSAGFFPCQTIGLMPIKNT